MRGSEAVRFARDHETPLTTATKASMMIEDAGYMHWAKTHPRVQFELTDSGMPSVDLGLLGATTDHVELQVRGDYGDPRLIDAIARRYDVPADHIVPVPAASSGNFIALASVCRRRDIVLVEHPVYDPITRVAAFLDLRVVPFHRRPEDGFEMHVDVRRIAREGRTEIRAVVMTNLHNPSGRYESPERIAALARDCRGIGAHLIVDEAYLDGACIVGGRAMETAARLGENVVAVNSMTKILGLAGLRVGWIIAEPLVVERARNVMDLISLNNAAPSASIALRAFERLADLENRYRRFHARGQRVYRKWLSEQSAARGYENHGGLFELLALPGGVAAADLCERLRADHDTQVTPGDFFGLPYHVRLSLTLEEKPLSEALDRLGRAMDEASAGVRTR